MKKLLMAVVCTFAIGINTVLAAPTVQVAGGNTTVQLSSEFVGALVSLGVTPSKIEPGRLNLKKGVLKYPIPGGAVDLGSLKGDIFHTGGLALEVPGTKVTLLNFIITTTGEAPLLNGLVTLNGDVVDRIPLFDLALTSEPSISMRGTLRIQDVIVTLNAVAADTLNAVFGVTAFVEGFPIGTATVKTRIMDTDDEDNDDDDKHHYGYHH